MAKRLSEKQKVEIINCFTNGKTIDELSDIYNFSKLTITRNLKKDLGEKKYQELNKKNKSNKKFVSYNIQNKTNDSRNELSKTNSSSRLQFENFDNEDSIEKLDETSEFIEIAPCNFDVDNIERKDLSSIPISEIDLPKVAYMIVDQQIELEIKTLKDFPQWQFLCQSELERKTIQIYFDMKIAKRYCSKEKKVIKVPNTNVFRVAAPILLSRGISRIVGEDKLIAL